MVVLGYFLFLETFFRFRHSREDLAAAAAAAAGAGGGEVQGQQQPPGLRQGPPPSLAPCAVLLMARAEAADLNLRLFADINHIYHPV